MSINLLYSFICFVMLQVLSWFATNLQLTEYAGTMKPLMVAVVLAIPTTLCAYYGTKFGYEAFGSAWSIRFFVFAISYLVFPVLTWWFLDESMFTAKTMLCVLLSLLIILIQLRM